MYNHLFLKRLSVFLLITISCAISATQTNLDSLNKRLAVTTGKEKALVHLELVKQYIKADLPKALSHAEQAVQISNMAGDSILVIEGLYQKGIIQYLSGIHDAALATYQEALDYSQKSKKFGMAALMLNEIGTLNKKQGDLEQSQNYFEQALEMSKAANDSGQIANSLNNLGIVYEQKGDYQKALIIFRESAEIKEKLNDLNALAYNLDNMGITYTKMGEFKQAKVQFLKAVEIRNKLGDKRGLAVVYNNIGELYMTQDSAKIAGQYFERALSLAMETNFKDLVQYIYKMLSDVYRIRGDFRKAVNYMQKHTALKDSIFNETRSRQLIELETKYETEKNRQQISLQEAKISEQKAQLLRNYALLLVLVLLIVFLVLGFYFFKKHQLKKQELAVEKAALNASITSQEDERKRFARDLHDGMGQLISACKIQISQIEDEKNKKEKQNYFIRSQHTLDEMHREIRNIAFNLMPATLISKGYVSAVCELADRINTDRILNIEVHKSAADLNLPETHEIFLYRITQEWLNNITKYAEAKKVVIQILQHPDSIIIMIEDNGIGFNLDKLVSGKGNGWTNIQSRLQFINGQVEIDSREGSKGTTFTITLPNRQPESKNGNGKSAKET